MPRPCSHGERLSSAAARGHQGGASLPGVSPHSPALVSSPPLLVISVPFSSESGTSRSRRGHSRGGRSQPGRSDAGQDQAAWCWLGQEMDQELLGGTPPPVTFPWISFNDMRIF